MHAKLVLLSCCLTAIGVQSVNDAFLESNCLHSNSKGFTCGGSSFLFIICTHLLVILSAGPNVGDRASLQV